MHHRLPTALTVACLCLCQTSLHAGDKNPGVVVGWDRHDGLVLLGELNCAACHRAEGAAAERLLAKQAPILDTVGARLTPQFLNAFLSDPQKVKAGSTMPDLLHGLPEQKREETVDALVHYLVSLGGPIDQRASGASKLQIERGQELYHSVGCVACHPPFAAPPKHKRDPAFIDDDDPKAKTPASPSVPLGDLATKTTVEALAQFLADPLHVRPSGRMPSLHLEPGEARMIAAYLLRDQYSEKEKAPGVGLDVAYYEGKFSKVPDFDKLIPKKEGEARNFDLGAILDANKLPAKKAKKVAPTRNSDFAVRFRGWIDIANAGTYRFWTTSDDGSVLRIDGKVVVDNDGIHAPAEKEGQVSLTLGKHTIEVGLIQGGGGYELTVLWQPPGAKARQPIPSGILLNASGGAMIPKGIVEFKPQPQKIDQGKKLFASLGCASCHITDRQQPKLAPLQAPGLVNLDVSKKGGCLSDSVAAGRPRFALNQAQRTAVIHALQGLSKPQPWTAKTRADHLMTSMNCFACHGRDGKGGPDRQRSDYFTYEVLVDLGDEGRMPPSLTGAGGKLTSPGFDDALFSGKRYRSSMATRMPHFGKANVGHLPELLAKVDQGLFAEHKPAFNSKMVADGRTFVGKTTLACINCHAWSGYRLPGAEGLDLLETTRRLQPGWFQAWLLNPNKIHPGTRMPTAWPDGKSFFADIQGGDTQKQIDAIWAYLAVGQKGGMPIGLAPADVTLLVPTDEPIVFRTFLDKVSAHAILVGFPQRTHLAFDANRVRTVVAWTGNFISTKEAWEGRAGEYAKVPSSDVLYFPDGPPFMQMKSRTEAWPADLPKLKLGSNRTPEGWRFLGYRFDNKRVPTFLYSIGLAKIEETFLPEVRPDGSILRRTLHVSAKEDLPNLYLRVAVGQKIEVKNGVFVVDDRYRYTIHATPGVAPFVRDSGGRKELVVPIGFRASTSGIEAAIDIEMLW